MAAPMIVSWFSVGCWLGVGVSCCLGFVVGVVEGEEVCSWSSGTVNVCVLLQPVVLPTKTLFSS